MLVKNVGVRGKCKLADRWEQDPYIVKAQPNPDIPVFEVQRENSRSKVRTLHRNLLLPFYGLPRFQEEDTQQQSDVSPAPQSINQSNTESDYNADCETSSESKPVNTHVSRAFEYPRLTEIPEIISMLYPWAVSPVSQVFFPDQQRHHQIILHFHQREQILHQMKEV